MERKYLFNTAVAAYARYRPGYPLAFLENVENICQLKPEAKILEIGCGTGQGSELFVTHNYRLHAVELGAELAAYAQNRFKNYANFSVEVLPFENFMSEEKFDLVFSASAFHWIDPLVGLKKAHGLLRDNGHLVLCWNHRKEKEIDVYSALSKAYEENVQNLRKNETPKHESISKDISASGLFTEPRQLSISFDKKMTSDEYLGLLGTYSDHLALEPATREKLFRSIKKIIDDYGGKITVPYETKIVIAKKRIADIDK